MTPTPGVYLVLGILNLVAALVALILGNWKIAIGLVVVAGWEFGAIAYFLRPDRSRQG